MGSIASKVCENTHPKVRFIIRNSLPKIVAVGGLTIKSLLFPTTSLGNFTEWSVAEQPAEDSTDRTFELTIVFGFPSVDEDVCWSLDTSFNEPFTIADVAFSYRSFAEVFHFSPTVPIWSSAAQSVCLSLPLDSLVHTLHVLAGEVPAEVVAELLET